MSGRLSTHVLDTAMGQPARGMRIDLCRLKHQVFESLSSFTTNADGRTDAPLLEDASLTEGLYRLDFYVADYFRQRGNADAGKFFEVVPVVFRIDNPLAKYHVPLLVSPWSYSTYRGS